MSAGTADAAGEPGPREDAARNTPRGLSPRGLSPRGLAARWERFWFEPAPPTNLGICRALFFGALFLYFLRTDYSGLGAVSRVFYDPYWLYVRVFPFPPPTQDVLAVVQVVWKVALLLGCLGLLTRVSTVVAFVLGLYLVGLPFNFGYTSHMNAAVTIATGIMALSRSGDAWSLDQLILRKRLGDRYAPPAPSPEYTWPVRLVWVLLSLVFFAAGVSKLRHSGLAWITSDTNAQFLRRAQYPIGRGALPPLTTWGLFVARHPLLYKSMAALTIMFEVGYPLALLGPRLRVLFAGSMVLLLIGVRLLLGPSFEMLVLCHLFWVPWDRVEAWARRRLARKQMDPGPA